MKKLSMIFAILLVLPSIALAVDCPVPDTGQTKCYDDSTREITCPSPGQPFYGQDAQYAPCNPHSYTTLGGGTMVQDNVTGLIWEVKTDDVSIHDYDDRYAWYDAQDVFITTLNSQNFGGHSDWRLPTIKELSTLINSNIPFPGPTINTDYFPNALPHGYWSSTTYAFYPDNAWIILFGDGYVGGRSKSDSYYVRAVRGGQCGSFANFIDNGNGTVTDTDTSLMWEKDTTPGTYTWQQALSYCETSTLAGYNDWRLPNRNELQSIVDYNRDGPSIDPIFSNTVSSYYWSSTSDAEFPDLAWVVYFKDGGVGGYYKSSHGRYCVRAVRAGRCGSSDTSTTTTSSPNTTTTTDIESTTTTSKDGQGCSMEEIYGEYSEEVELLKTFRDNVLSKTLGGREIIKFYYQWSPVIVKTMEADEEFREEVKEMIEGVLELIGGDIE